MVYGNEYYFKAMDKDIALMLPDWEVSTKTEGINEPGSLSGWDDLSRNVGFRMFFTLGGL